METTLDPMAEHLGIDTHPASTGLLSQLVRGRPLTGYDVDEWGVWVNWAELEQNLVQSERAVCELARAIAAIESCGGVPPRLVPVAREATAWALGEV